MTEEEAKTKWCPMARVALNGCNQYVAGNWDSRGISEVEQHDYFKCIGSGCMMWRPHGPKESLAGEHGHCGLAGAPF